MKARADWTAKIKCPFCSALIVEGFDFTQVPDDLSTEEAEEFTCGDAGIDRVEGRCDHLALLSQYPDGWTDVFPGRMVELTRYANSISSKLGPEKPVASEDVESELEMLICESVEELHAYDNEQIPDLAIDIQSIYVEKGDGPRGGGPSYCAIFIHKH